MVRTFAELLVEVADAMVFSRDVRRSGHPQRLVNLLLSLYILWGRPRRLNLRHVSNLANKR